MDTKDKSSNFEIEYEHPGFKSDSPKLEGYFRITLENRLIPNLEYDKGNTPDHMFNEISLLDSAEDILEGEKSSLSFNREYSKFCLYFIPYGEDMTKITEETSQGLMAILPRTSVTKKLLDCYRDVCEKNDIELDENRFLYRI